MNPEPNTTHMMCNCPAEIVAASADGKAVLLAIRLSPWGEVQSTNGTYVMDDEAAAEIVAAFAKHGTALPIDREHETLPQNTPATGSRGAVGWIEDVYPEPGNGLMGKVRWTDEGRALVRADAFRYLSPVLMVRTSDRRAVALHSAAMTNKPAIPQMDRLAASQTIAVSKAENVVIHPVPTAIADQVWSDMPDALSFAGRVCEIPVSVEAALADVRTLVERMSLTELGRALPLLRALAPKTQETAEVVALKEQVAALELKERELVVEAMIDKAAKENRLHLMSEKLPKLRTLAMRDLNTAQLVIALLPSFPMPGQMVKPLAPSVEKRMRALLDIRREYSASRTTQKLTSLVDFVNSELRSRDLEPLTNSEREAYARDAAAAV